jgi:hypothetical protein
MKEKKPPAWGKRRIYEEITGRKKLTGFLSRLMCITPPALLPAVA